MAIANNSDLKTLIANYMLRSDLTAEIVDFIRLTEARIVGDFAENHLLNKLVESETISTDANPKALDSGYRGTVVAYIDANPKRVLDFMAPDDFFKRYAASQTNEPRAYTIQGMNLHFGPEADSTYSIIHWFVKMPDIETDTTNSILTNHPNLYLYGALSEGWGFLGNDIKAQQYEGRYLRTLDSLAEEARNFGSLQMHVYGAGAGTPRRAR